MPARYRRSMMLARLTVILLILTVGSARRPRAFSSRYAFRRLQRLLLQYVVRITGSSRSPERQIESQRRAFEPTL